MVLAADIKKPPDKSMVDTKMDDGLRKAQAIVQQLLRKLSALVRFVIPRLISLFDL